eukprot:6813411-Pyramimonas_sp.AAC.1
MRGSAAGKGEVTIATLRAAGGGATEEIIDLAEGLWRAPHKKGEPIARTALCILWKGKGSRTGPNSYRQIVLVSFIIRVIARSLAKRLLARAEGSSLALKIIARYPPLNPVFASVGRAHHGGMCQG